MAMANKPDISNLKNCIEEAKISLLDDDRGPEDPTDYHQLMNRLNASRYKLPPLYRDMFFQPYVDSLNQIGEQGFNSILIAGSQGDGTSGLMLDIAQAILQNGEGYNWVATDAFEEVVSDLYDGFLSAEDRRGIDPPDRGTIPPLVKWGNPNSGPYTWPVDATLSFGLKAGVVSLPPSHARSSILVWSGLAHETAGHDITHAYTGLFHQLSRAVQDALDKAELNDGLPDYWSTRLDETTSDVLGILNMGPMPGLGVMGYFRAISEMFSGEPKLDNGVPMPYYSRDPHPTGILRGYLAAFTVKLLSFEGADDWAKIIKSETDKDLSTIYLEGNKVDPQKAIRSAEIVASTIVSTKLESLENHSFGEIQNWLDYDEFIVQRLIPSVTSMRPPDLDGAYAAHVVAASIEAALSKNADIQFIFRRMINILKSMHDKNPSWGPLFVKHPGNVTRHLFSGSFNYYPRQMRMMSSNANQT